MEVVKSCCKSSIIFVGTLFLISLVQWLIVLVYHTYCLDRTFYGFITNMVTIGGPLCQALNRIQLTLSENYIAYLGVGLVTLFSGINRMLF